MIQKIQYCTCHGVTIIVHTRNLSIKIKNSVGSSTKFERSSIEYVSISNQPSFGPLIAVSGHPPFRLIDAFHLILSIFYTDSFFLWVNLKPQYLQVSTDPGRAKEMYSTGCPKAPPPPSQTAISLSSSIMGTLLTNS